MTEPNPFARGAPVWRAAGWPGTILLPHGEKSPPPTDYTGALGLEPDDAKVREWAELGGNLGIRMPMGVIGLDVDHHKPEGPESFRELIHVCGPMPPTWRSSARPDARSGIYLYRTPVGVKLRGNPLPAIEVIQFHHRYMVTWPSIHPSGDKYRLTDPQGRLGVTQPPRIDELPWLPEDWLKQLVEPERPAGATAPRRNTGEWSRAVAAAYAETQLALLQTGGRHDAMLQGAGALTRLDHLGHPGAHEALEALGAQFVQAVGDRSNAAQAEAELRRILAGAEAQISSTPATTPPWQEPLERYGSRTSPNGARAATSQPTVPLEPLEAPPDPLEGWEAVNLAELIEAGLENDLAELLCREDGTGLLYAGKVNTLFGSSGSGKTWIALLAIAQEVKAGRRCLYLDWEDDPRTFVRRLRLLGCGDEHIIAYAHYITPLVGATMTVVGHLAAHGYRLIVLDSTGEALAAHGRSENDGTDVAAWMGLLPRPLARAGACVVLVDHVPHATEGMPREVGSQRKRAAISGASYLVEQLEGFSKDRSGKVVLRVGKDRGGNFARGQVVAEALVLTAEDAVRIELRQPLWTDAQGKVVRPTEAMVKVSTYIATHPGCTYSEITGAKLGRKQTIGQALRVLIEDGYVVREGDDERHTTAARHRSAKPYDPSEDPMLKGPDELEDRP